MSWERLKRDYSNIVRRDTLRDITEEGIGGGEAEEELERRVGTGAQFPELIESISVALELEGHVAEDAISPKWNIRTAEVIKIIRQERGAVRREAARKAREALERARNSGGGSAWRGEHEE